MNLGKNANSLIFKTMKPKGPKKEKKRKKSQVYWKYTELDTPAPADSFFDQFTIGHPSL